MGKKWYKSKTLNLNAIYLAVIAGLTQGFGITISPELVAAGGVILNSILRVFTTEPLA
jgi:hypothetical protein